MFNITKEELSEIKRIIAIPLDVKLKEINDHLDFVGLAILARPTKYEKTHGGYLLQINQIYTTINKPHLIYSCNR